LELLYDLTFVVAFGTAAAPAARKYIWTIGGAQLGWVGLTLLGLRFSTFLLLGSSQPAGPHPGRKIIGYRQLGRCHLHRVLSTLPVRLRDQLID
jgi:hypothetical protein